MAVADAGVLEQAGTKWRRVVLALIVGGVPTAICFILGAWWWGTLCMLLTLFVACFFFSPVLRPTVFSILAVLTVGWFVGAWIDVALYRAGVGDVWWRDALPVVGGFVFGLVVTALFLFAAFAVSTKWILGLDESHDDIGWWKAFAFVALRAFGYAQPRVLVQNGKMSIGSKKGLFAQSVKPELVPKSGGPAMLVVGEGNVVVLERAGQLSRILGQGTHVLQRGEWFLEPVEDRGIHSLGGAGGDPETVKNVLTKDGYPLDITIGGRGKLELKADTDKRPESRFADGEANSPVLNPGTQFAIYRETVRKAAGGGWRKKYPKGAAGQLRDVVATYALDQILGDPGTEQELESDKRVAKQIEEKVKDLIGTDPANGVVFGGISILDIKMPKDAPEDVRKAMLERWASPIQRDVRVKEAETSRQVVEKESEGRVKEIQNLARARLEASASWLEVIEKLKEVLPEVESPRVAYGFVSVIRDLLSRVGVDEKDDIRRLIELQRLLSGDGPHRAGEGMPLPQMIPGQSVVVEDAEKEEPKPDG